MFKMNTSKALFLSLLSLTPCALYSTDVPSEFNFTAVGSVKRHYKDFTLSDQVYNIPQALLGELTMVQGPLINITSNLTVIPFSYTICDAQADGVEQQQTLSSEIVFRTHFPVVDDLYRVSFRFIEGDNEILPGIKVLNCFTDVYWGTPEENHLYATFHQMGEQLDQNYQRPRHIRFSAKIQQKDGDVITPLGENRIDSLTIHSVTSSTFHDYEQRLPILDQGILRSERIDLGMIPFDGHIFSCWFSLKIHGKAQEDDFRYGFEPNLNVRITAIKLMIFLKPNDVVSYKAITAAAPRGQPQAQ